MPLLPTPRELGEFALFIFYLPHATHKPPITRLPLCFLQHNHIRVFMTKTILHDPSFLFGTKTSSIPTDDFHNYRKNQKNTKEPKNLKKPRGNRSNFVLPSRVDLLHKDALAFGQLSSTLILFDNPNLQRFQNQLNGSHF